MHICRKHDKNRQRLASRGLLTFQTSDAVNQTRISWDMAMGLLFVLYFLSIVTVVTSYQAGECFSRINRRGKCEGLMYKNLSVVECCSRGKYYTLQSDSDENLFRSLTLKSVNGVKGVANCYSCKNWLKNLKKESCANKVCEQGKVCLDTQNTVKCVCKTTNCIGINKPVCSNMNHTYTSECSLNDTACRQHKNEWVEYDGVCTASCGNVQCRDNKQCIQDQSSRLHCVHCARSCPKPTNNSTTVCALNGVTYPSHCHLRKATCQLGKTIGVAYAGRCVAGATCSSMKCSPGKKCFMHNKKPHCVDCSISCSKNKKGIYSPHLKHTTRLFGNRVCGSNGLTYNNRCVLRKYMCVTNTYITAKYHGRCKGSKIPFQANPGKNRPALTADQIKKLRNQFIKVKQLIKMIKDMGLNITLNNASRKGKRVAVYPIICQIVKIVTGTKLIGCP